MAIKFELRMSRETHSLYASLQQHISNWIWVLNVQGDSLPGCHCKFTGAYISAIQFELRMSMVAHCLDAIASSQEHIYQQSDLSSECQWWLTGWMQVYRGMSAIGLELRMSRVTHSLDASSQEHIGNWIELIMSRVTHYLDTSSQEHISNWIWALNVHGDSLSGCKFIAAYDKSAVEFELWISMVTHCLDKSSQEHVSNWIWAMNIQDDSLSGCKFTRAYQ